MELFYIISASFFIMLASLSGIMFIAKNIESWVEKNVNYLVAFSGGVFIVVVIDLISEALEFAGSQLIVWISVIIGILSFFLLDKIYPETHCLHTDKTCLRKKSGLNATKVLLGDSIHNIGDGVLLAAVFIIDIRVGIIATLGILAHEFVQEISEFFVLKGSGYSTKQALIKNFMVSATILIGAVGGFYLTSFEFLVGPLIGIAAGAFIHILLVDLLPRSIKDSHTEKKYIRYGVLTLVGVFTILSFNSAAGYFLEKQGLDSHGHSVEEAHDEDQEESGDGNRYEEDELGH